MLRLGQRFFKWGNRFRGTLRRVKIQRHDLARLALGHNRERTAANLAVRYEFL